MAAVEVGGAGGAGAREATAPPDSTSGKRQEHVSDLEALKVGRPTKVELSNGQDVLLYRVPGKAAAGSTGGGSEEVLAVGNRCPHKDAEMHRGDIEDIGAAHTDGGPSLCIRCPKHQRKFCGGLYFSLENGKSHIKGKTSKYDPRWTLPTYPVTVREGEVFLQVDTKFDGLPSAEHRRSKWALGGVKRCSHDSYLYLFGTDEDEATATGFDVESAAEQLLPSAQCWHVSLELHYKSMISRRKKKVARDYTPVSSIEDFRRGRLAILIKVYSDGKLTSRLPDLRIGKHVHVSVPEPTLDLPSLCRPRDGTPVVAVDSVVDGTACDVGLIAGGTGIAPMWQVMRSVMSQPERFGGSPTIRLIDSNKSVEDILLAKEIAAFAEKHARSVKVLHTITGDSVPDDWEGCAGRLDAAQIDFLPPPAPTTHIVVSGPVGLNKAAKWLLGAAGYDKSMVCVLEA